MKAYRLYRVIEGGKKGDWTEATSKIKDDLDKDGEDR